MKRIAIIMVLIFSFSAPCLASSIGFSFQDQGYNFVAEPRLRSPIYDSVTISNDEPVEFSWWNDVMNTRGFILKLYKGYNMYADNLILKEDLPAGADSFKIKTDLFEEGQVYTWSLIRVSLAGYKSDKSFNSFKVIKK
jgi:hypothetical protein